MKNSFFISIIVLLFISGCTLVNVESVNKDEANVLGSAKTYSWFEQDLLTHENQVKNSAARNYITQAIEKELAEKGYAKVPADRADILITWFGKVDKEVDRQSVSHFYNTYGYGAISDQFLGEVEGDRISKAYKKGTLVIDVADPEIKKVVWRGSATDTFTADMAENEVAAYLNRSVKKAMSAFPAAVK